MAVFNCTLYDKYLESELRCVGSFDGISCQCSWLLASFKLDCLGESCCIHTCFFFSGTLFPYFCVSFEPILALIWDLHMWLYLHGVCMSAHYSWWHIVVTLYNEMLGQISSLCVRVKLSRQRSLSEVEQINCCFEFLHSTDEVHQMEVQ